MCKWRRPYFIVVVVLGASSCTCRGLVVLVVGWLSSSVVVVATNQKGDTWVLEKLIMRMTSEMGPQSAYKHKQL